MSTSIAPLTVTSHSGSPTHQSKGRARPGRAKRKTPEKPSAGSWFLDTDPVLLCVPHSQAGEQVIRLLPEDSGVADAEDYANARLMASSRRLYDIVKASHRTLRKQGLDMNYIDGVLDYIDGLDDEPPPLREASDVFANQVQIIVEGGVASVKNPNRVPVCIIDQDAQQTSGDPYDANSVRVNVWRGIATIQHTPQGVSAVVIDMDVGE